MTYYVPDATIRILSICHYREDCAGQVSSFFLDDYCIYFTFPSSGGDGNISFNYRGSNYIPHTTVAQNFGKSMELKKLLWLLIRPTMSTTEIGRAS